MMINQDPDQRAFGLRRIGGNKPGFMKSGV